jgi:eukaryotic-like serine/threonine-protein kinase
MAVGARSSLLAGRYRVDRLLGRGGMAAVYLALDERLGRQVAVKRLHTDSSEETARRFAREAKLGASLNHPNLVWVFDTVADEEDVLIVMEYVEGTTLARELESGPLEPGRAADVIEGVARALDHAHEHGVVHRDVKPANVLLGKRGAIKLADLGIATAAEHTRITRSGVVLGTASYVAPEQLNGERPSPASDIYSLASVAFEALTGVKARRGRTPVEIAHAIVTAPPPDLREEWQDAPAAAAEVLNRGMARDRADRPATAVELATELATALRDEPPRRERPRRPARMPAAPRVEEEVPDPLPVAAARRAAPRRRRGLPAFLPVALLVAALLAAGLIALGSSGGDNSPSRSADRGSRKEASPPARSHPKGPAEPSTPSAPAGSPTPAPSPTAGGTDEGARLNDQGYRLMNQGRYSEAVPILRRAVAAFPSGSTDLTYGYALYNLGRALRLSGRPKEAIPVLERRLRIPNQQATVKRELDAARRAARSQG